jgi:NAD(P)-dependent dehydrogenase (short-subunit alcohol dehydrogenase family)
MPGHAHDVAARAGVAGFTRSIARELGADAPIQRDEVPEDLVGTTF